MKPIAIAIVAGLSVCLIACPAQGKMGVVPFGGGKPAAAQAAEVKPAAPVPAGNDANKADAPPPAQVAQPAAAAKDPVAQPAQAQPAPAQPAVQPAVVRAAALNIKRVGVNMKLQRDRQKTSIKNLPDGGTFKMSDIVRFSMAEGKLKAEWVGNFPTGQRRIKIDGSDATYVVTQYNQPPNTQCTLVRYDFEAADDDFWSATLSLQGQSIISLSGQGGDAADVAQIFFTQQPTIVSMSVSSSNENGQFRQVFNGRAGDFQTLRSEHSDEVRRYLAPLVRKITGQSLLQPGASDVYKVFTQIQADPKVSGQIDALLPSLISSEAAEREKAAAQLAKLGAPGALAALRYDPSALAPEQQSRLDDLIQAHSRMVIDDPAAALADADFLLDCIENEDQTIRNLAKGALEKTLGRKVNIDTKVVGKKLELAVDGVRKELAKTRKAEEKKAAVQNVAPQNGVPQPQPQVQILPALRGNVGGLLVAE